MILDTRLIMTLVLSAGLVAGLAQAQQDAPADGDESGLAEVDVPSSASLYFSDDETSYDEEVVVRGRTYGTIRAQVERAEIAVYDRFNEINSHDDYDIHCKYYAETGSKMLRRRCMPNYWHDLNAQLGEEFARGLQGSGYTIGAGAFVNEQRYKTGLLVDEMRELAREDPELQSALIHLRSLQEQQALYRDSRRENRQSRKRERRSD